jgi:alpha-N-arabinofuranosidase
MRSAPRGRSGLPANQGADTSTGSAGKAVPFKETIVPATFVLDVGKAAGEISPLWFGHNLEHTRSCVWQGLGAQLVRNRKFAGLPQRDGVAGHWYRIGPRQCWHLLEIAGGEKGTAGEPYTAHLDPRVPGAGQRQRIESFEGGTCGIGQRGIPLVGGRAYEGRAALLADSPLSVRIAVSAADPGATCVTVEPGDWTEAEFRFTAVRTDFDARLEVTFDGPGVLFVGAVSLLPADHFLGMRRDVIDLLKEISVPILRWPGGNFAGDYRWKDGLLPVDRRAPLESPPYTQPHTDGFDYHEIGTDEFIALCRELNAEPFITINMSLEGPGEAAAWVEYCNGPASTTWGRRRAERGHREPYNVKHWTLGNEMGYSHMAGPHTPEAYGELARACARAMRGVDPSIVLTASTGWAREWYEGVLASPEDYFDNISLHAYYGIMTAFTGEEGRRQFRRLAESPFPTFHGTSLEGGAQGGRRLTLRDVRDFINARPRGRKDIGIAFDEWNVRYAWYREPTVAEGIHAAVMLNLFCREAANVGMTIGAFFEPVNEGAILVEPASARLTPVGRVHALFRAHHGNRLIPALPSPRDGDLDLAASFSRQRHEITVTAVNASPDRGREAEIVLTGASGCGSARGVLLSAPGFLPGCEFREGPIEVRKKADQTFALALPKHSVAGIQVPCQPDS